MSRLKKKQGDNVPEWMVSYCDLQQLLLVFFILLFSTAATDSEKLEEVLSSFQNGSGVLNKDGNKVVELDNSKKGEGENTNSKEEKKEKSESEVKLEKLKEKYDKEMMNANLKDSQLIESEIKDSLSQTGLTSEQIDNTLEVTNTSEGVLLRLKDNVAFELASTEIKESSKKILDALGESIKNSNRKVRIEGHTDDIPVSSSSKFESNWEISTERAISVMNYFNYKGYSSPDKFSITGYAEHKPIAKNDSVENRALNRRVDIILLNN